VDLQRFGDGLRLAAGKEVIDGAKRRTSPLHHLPDAEPCEAAFAEQSFGGIDHPLTTGA
jgi:hypothetical protein